ncbi:hypothetical protein ABKS89_25095 [Pseudomonas sp. LABIM340]|uniref:hypothetical protein n=1 Tax=Pseudomonas sp. LABIM340 TaxID=3156585 RepID=UPI0032AE89F9
MSEEHRKLIGIPEGHTLKQAGSEREQRKGRDTDIDFYEELNEAGELVAKYEVRESMSIYPPFTNHVSFKKLD